jgi:hypothetical protein
METHKIIRRAVLVAGLALEEQDIDTRSHNSMFAFRFPRQPAGFCPLPNYQRINN